MGPALVAAVALSGGLVCLPFAINKAQASRARGGAPAQASCHGRTRPREGREPRGLAPYAKAKRESSEGRQSGGHQVVFSSLKFTVAPAKNTVAHYNIFVYL